MKYKKLNNNLKIPVLAFGTFRLKNDSNSIDIVYNAIKNGYRHIDTAYDYGCEYAVGEGIKKAINDGICQRSDLFITTKLLSSEQGYDSTIKNFEKSLKNLNLEYIDCYLIHHPLYNEPNWQRYTIDTWRAFEYLYEKGLVKSIGVSNFQKFRLEYLLKNSKIKPMINQIELHPNFQQEDLVDFCKCNNIQVCAWGALNQGRILKNDMLKKLSGKYNKNIAQVVIRWSIEKDFIPIVFAETEEKIITNLHVFDFSLSKEDVEKINSLKKYKIFSGWHIDNDKEYILIKKFKLFSFMEILKIETTNDLIKYYFLGIPVLKIVKRYK